MAEKEVLEAVAIHAEFDEIRQGPGAEVKQQEVVCLDQIACSRALRMQICTGAKNDQAHDIILSLW